MSKNDLSKVQSLNGSNRMSTQGPTTPLELVNMKLDNIIRQDTKTSTIPIEKEANVSANSRMMSIEGESEPLKRGSGGQSQVQKEGSVAKDVGNGGKSTSIHSGQLIMKDIKNIQFVQNQQNMKMVNEVLSERRSLSPRFPINNDYKPSDYQPDMFQGPPLHHILPGSKNLGPMNPTSYRYRKTKGQFYTHLDLMKNQFARDNKALKKVEMYNQAANAKQQKFKQDLNELERISKNQIGNSVYADNFLSYAKTRIGMGAQDRHYQTIDVNSKTMKLQKMSQMNETLRDTEKPGILKLLNTDERKKEQERQRLVTQEGARTTNLDLNMVEVKENPTRVTVEGVASSRFAMSSIHTRGANSQLDSAIQNQMIPQLHLSDLAQKQDFQNQSKEPQAQKKKLSEKITVRKSQQKKQRVRQGFQPIKVKEMQIASINPIVEASSRYKQISGSTSKRYSNNFSVSTNTAQKHAAVEDSVTIELNYSYQNDATNGSTNLRERSTAPVKYMHRLFNSTLGTARSPKAANDLANFQIQSIPQVQIGIESVNAARAGFVYQSSRVNHSVDFTKMNMIPPINRKNDPILTVVNSQESQRTKQGQSVQSKINTIHIPSNLPQPTIKSPHARNIKILSHIHRRSQTAVEAGDEEAGLTSRLKSRLVYQDQGSPTRNTDKKSNPDKPQTIDQESIWKPQKQSSFRISTRFGAQTGTGKRQRYDAVYNSIELKQQFIPIETKPSPRATTSHRVPQIKKQSNPTTAQRTRKNSISKQGGADNNLMLISQLDYKGQQELESNKHSKENSQASSPRRNEFPVRMKSNPNKGQIQKKGDYVISQPQQSALQLFRNSVDTGFPQQYQSFNRTAQDNQVHIKEVQMISSQLPGTGLTSINTNHDDKDSLTNPIVLSDAPFSNQNFHEHMKLMVEIDKAHGLIQDNRNIQQFKEQITANEIQNSHRSNKGNQKDYQSRPQSKQDMAAWQSQPSISNEQPNSRLQPVEELPLIDNTQSLDDLEKNQQQQVSPLVLNQVQISQPKIKVNDDLKDKMETSFMKPQSSNRKTGESQLSVNKYQTRETSPSKKRIVQDKNSPLNLDLPVSSLKVGAYKMVLEKSQMKSARKASILTIEAELPSAREVINNQPSLALQQPQVKIRSTPSPDRDPNSKQSPKEERNAQVLVQKLYPFNLQPPLTKQQKQPEFAQKRAITSYAKQHAQDGTSPNTLGFGHLDGFAFPGMQIQKKEKQSRNTSITQQGKRMKNVQIVYKSIEQPSIQNALEEFPKQTTRSLFGQNRAIVSKHSPKGSSRFGSAMAAHSNVTHYRASEIQIDPNTTEGVDTFDPKIDYQQILKHAQIFINKMPISVQTQKPNQTSAEQKNTWKPPPMKSPPNFRPVMKKLNTDLKEVTDRQNPKIANLKISPNDSAIVTHRESQHNTNQTTSRVFEGFLKPMNINEQKNITMESAPGAIPVITNDPIEIFQDKTFDSHINSARQNEQVDAQNQSYNIQQQNIIVQPQIQAKHVKVKKLESIVLHHTIPNVSSQNSSRSNKNPLNTSISQLKEKLLPKGLLISQDAPSSFRSKHTAQQQIKAILAQTLDSSVDPTIKAPTPVLDTTVMTCTQTNFQKQPIQLKTQKIPSHQTAKSYVKNKPVAEKKMDNKKETAERIKESEFLSKYPQFDFKNQRGDQMHQDQKQVADKDMPKIIQKDKMLVNPKAVTLNL